MIWLSSSGALGGINVKLASAVTRHNWLADAHGVATAAQSLLLGLPSGKRAQLSVDHVNIAGHRFVLSLA
ncbi:MAG TPA: hypothetical protein VGI46_15615 [Candidatus Acidoferrum sp.]